MESTSSLLSQIFLFYFSSRRILAPSHFAIFVSHQYCCFSSLVFYTSSCTCWNCQYLWTRYFPTLVHLVECLTDTCMWLQVLYYSMNNVVLLDDPSGQAVWTARAGGSGLHFPLLRPAISGEGRVHHPSQPGSALATPDSQGSQLRWVSHEIEILLNIVCRQFKVFFIPNNITVTSLGLPVPLRPPELLPGNFSRIPNVFLHDSKVCEFVFFFYASKAK